MSAWSVHTGMIKSQPDETQLNVQAELQEISSSALFPGHDERPDLLQISHDLNNYLTILMIHCDELRSELSTNEQRRTRFNLLYDNLRLAASIVNELSFPQNATPPTLSMSLVDFVEFLEEQSDVWRLLTGKSLLIELDMQLPKEAANTEIILIPNYVKRALIQMIQNAAETVYNADTSASTGRIRLWLEMEGRHLLLHITDNGSGIAPHLREVIFQPGITSKDGQHRGHGLTSAVRLTKLWGGRIALLPSDEGAHFTLSFPMKARMVETRPNS